MSAVVAREPHLLPRALPSKAITFSKFRSAGDVAGMGDFVARGGNVTVNVAGSVVTEGQLVENIREGLLLSQRSGRQLVM